MRPVFVAALLAASSARLAVAQDQGPPPPAPPPAPAPPALMPPPVAEPAPAEDDLAPLRLSAVIADAAAAQRRARIADGLIGIVGGGGGLATGGILLTLDFGAGPQADAAHAVAYIAMGFGGLTILTSALDLFSRGSLERLDEVYAPIARDRNIPADKRLAEGERALEGLASSARSGRIIGGITSIVIGLGLGVAAIPLVAALPDQTADEKNQRVYFGLAFGLTSFAALANGVTAIVVKRSEAEKVWSLWLAGTGRQAALRPFVSPVAGGAVGGVGAVF